MQNHNNNIQNLVSDLYFKYYMTFPPYLLEKKSVIGKNFTIHTFKINNNDYQFKLSIKEINLPDLQDESQTYGNLEVFSNNNLIFSQLHSLYYNEKDNEIWQKGHVNIFKDGDWVKDFQEKLASKSDNI